MPYRNVPDPGKKLLFETRSQIAGLLKYAAEDLAGSDMVMADGEESKSLYVDALLLADRVRAAKADL